MAIIKKKEFLGLEPEYWAIVSRTWNKFENKTSCVLGLYFNKHTRELGVRNVVYREEFSFDGELNSEQLYEKIKEPYPLGEDGVQLNFFADAMDDI